MNAIKTIILTLILMGTTLCANAQSMIKHEVLMGETLYSISRTFGVSVDAIKAANPKLGDTLMAGQVINIPPKGTATTKPDAVPMRPVVPSNPSAITPRTMTSAVTPTGCKQMYKVEKKETVYSISHKFGITEAELLKANPQISGDKIKKGEYICIPFSARELAEQNERAEQQRLKAEREAREKAEREARERAAAKYHTLNVAVILPFGLNNSKKSAEAIKMIDFYEGFLLGVDRMKQKGHNINVYAYEETGTTSASIDSLLNLTEMKHMHLIIGPMRQEHIPTVSNFCQKNGINLVAPFSTRSNLVDGYTQMFQVNSNMAELYPTVYTQFLNRHQNDNFCFVNVSDKGTKTDFISGMKAAMQERGREFKSVEAADLTDMSKVLSDNSKRTILIPTSSSQSAFETIARNIAKNAGADSLNISFFGQPEWQTFSEKNLSTMHKYHASFYTNFYAAPGSELQSFNTRFTQWFKRSQQRSFPQFGLIGYDIANYFIDGIKTYGDDFAAQQDNLQSNALQNPMRFTRKGAGSGFINKYVTIIDL